MNSTMSEDCDCGSGVIEALVPPFVASVCLLLIEQLLAASDCKANSTLQLLTGAVKHLLSLEKDTANV